MAGTRSLSAALLGPPPPHPLPHPPALLGKAGRGAACPQVRAAGAFPAVLKAAWQQADWTYNLCIPHFLQWAGSLDDFEKGILPSKCSIPGTP